MINVFDYTDFRKYLTDYYEYRKKEFSHFSYRLLTMQAGLNAGNFIKMLKGERNLSTAAAIKLTHSLKMNKRERDYFQTMVRFCQAKKHEDKKIYFEEMLTFKESAVRVLDTNQYMFYDKWYYTAVREALAFYPLTDGNFCHLGKYIIPSISEKQVAQAIKVLKSLGLVEMNESGRYIRTNDLLSTGNDIRSLILNNFIIDTMKLAAEAINSGLKETNLSSVTFSISSKEFDEVQRELRQCRRKVLEIAKNCTNPDRVFQFNMQFFPLTVRNEGEQS